MGTICKMLYQNYAIYVIDLYIIVTKFVNCW